MTPALTWPRVAELWRGVEHLISEGKVGGAGLSDLHPPVFFSIYNEATIKPTSIQVLFQADFL